jgi:hypothetical protein
MWSSPSHQRQAVFNVREDVNPIRPYNNALIDLTGSMCKAINLEKSEVCLFETRLAFDCLLRRKVSKFGDMEDNLGHCHHHIDSMKSNIAVEKDVSAGFASVLDGKLNELAFMRKSFV